MNEQPQHIEIMVDGEMFYEGDDWREAFFKASQDPRNGTITLYQDGDLFALVGPVLCRQVVLSS